MINKINKKYNIILLTFIMIFVIIITILKTFADDNLNTRTVHYTIGSTVNYAFDFFTDCIKFHTKASGYEKYKGMETENNMNSMIGTDTAKMQGYGNYEFKPDTNLFSFIDYCYSKEPETVMACAYMAGTTEVNTYDYPVLLSYRDRQINTNYFKYFWQNMNNLCPNFKDYQDDFFFLKYTYPATQKIGINLAMLRKLYNDEESIKEYLTCLTSYIFSITPQAQVEGMTFGKGDVVPFLYYKDKHHANIDVRNDSESLKDIAKYAYVALIEGWCNLPTPYHLWENEYNFLFGTYDHNDLDYDLETLHQWYDETYQKYCKDKGRKGNNLLGSDINHIIESDYSIEQQLEATEYYLRQVFNELGIESDFKETIARNELMAKYMMQNSSFDETIKDYNITIKFMTENLQRGTHEEKNTHTVVTSDFQTLEFNYKINERFVKHSDEDTLSDGAELGNEKWINITEFVNRTYEDAVRNGEPHKATFEEQVEDIIEKNGAYTDSNGNKVYGSVKWNDTKTKVLYRVYDYKSNPKLNDTDFDGLCDNADSKPLDNKFKGTSTGIDKVEYNQDFRWFYTNNKKYNDEVAVMSLIMSNLADGNSIRTDQASGDIITYLKSIGFMNPQNIGEYGDNIYIAKKTIQYYDQKKDVVGVFLGRCDRWYSDVIKYKENQKAQVINTAYRESLENYIIRIINKVNLIATSDCSYWVAGYDVGGSIASEISAKLIDTGREVYAYTFGAFNTRDTMDTKTEIKNIRNEDDFAVKFITGTKSGQNYGASIFEDLMWEYRGITDSSDYKGNYIFTNFLLKVYDETKFLSINNDSDAVRITTDYFMTFNKITNQNDIENYADLSILLNKWADGNRQAHSIKSYYVLAKSLNGFDLLDGDGEKQEKYNRVKILNLSSEQMEYNYYQGNFELLKIIESVGNFYINNVPTYQKNMNKNSNYFYETRPARDNIKPYLLERSVEDVPKTMRNSYDFYKEVDELESDKKIIVTYKQSRNKYEKELGFKKTINSRIVKQDVSGYDKNMITNSNSESEKICSYNGSYWYRWRNYFTEKGEDNILSHAIPNGFDIGKSLPLNTITEYARDDCTGFVKFVLDLLISYKGYKKEPLPLDFNSSTLLGTGNKISKYLMEEGFEVYKGKSAGNDNSWLRYKDGAEQENIYRIKAEDLEPGDLLVCDNCGTKTEYKIKDDKSDYEIVYNRNNPMHAEFYIGHNYDITYNRSINTNKEEDKFKEVDGFKYTNTEKINVIKKSGIETMRQGDEIKIKKGKAEGTFSWGNIQDEFPLESSSGQKHYFYKKDNEAFFRHCECGEEPEKEVKICRNLLNGKVKEYTELEIKKEKARGVVLEEKTELFSVHMLSTKGCYFNERKYDTLWRFMK